MAQSRHRSGRSVHLTNDPYRWATPICDLSAEPFVHHIKHHVVAVARRHGLRRVITRAPPSWLWPRGGAQAGLVLPHMTLRDCETRRYCC